MRSLLLLLVLGLAAGDLAPLYTVKNKIEGSYIVKFKNGLNVDTAADDVERRLHRQRFGRSKFHDRFYKIMKGVAVELSDAALEFIRNLDEVEYVVEDGIAEAQWSEPWGVDRINQRDMPLDSNYKTAPEYNQGEGVEIWVLDTGIRPTHREFGGRASIALDTYGHDGTDCQGHGTHCAGTAAGGYYGVAKKATVKGVRVLGLNSRCDKYGAHSKIAKGLDHVLLNARKPAVVSMSIGGPGSSVMENAIKRVVAAGIPVVVSAGNDNEPACNSSPALLSEVITVGSTKKKWVLRYYDKRSSFSNYGSCVDIFAPGTFIVSAGHEDDSATKVMSGTSMACPHVTGIVALYLSENPNLTPVEVKAKLIDNATKGEISDVGDESPNLMAYIKPY